MPFNPYYGSYQPPYYTPPMADQLTQLRQGQQFQPPVQQPVPQQPAQPSSSGIVWVQGEEGAKAYMVAAGNSVLLMDSENSAFYIKSTDPSGMPQPLRIFDYTERTAVQKAPAATKPSDMEFVTRKEFDALAARLDALANKETPKGRTAKGDAE